MTWLVRLYPRAWRRRYEEEFLELLQAQPPSLRLWFDVVAGAVDAHLYPQRTTQTDVEAKMQDVATGQGECLGVGRALTGAGAIIALSAVAVLGSISLARAGWSDASELVLQLSSPVSVTLTMPLWSPKLSWMAGFGFTALVATVIVAGWAANLG